VNIYTFLIAICLRFLLTTARVDIDKIASKAIGIIGEPSCVFGFVALLLSSFFASTTIF